MSPLTTAPATSPAEEKPQVNDKLSVTEHSITIGGKVLKYKATAGTLAQKDDGGNAKAEIFFVAYAMQSDAPATNRPITFVFNGGPGAAAVWLHLGAAGPKRIKLDEKGFPPAPPYSLVDNESTWLDATDLVFIDPVGTGYSRPTKGEKAEQFYGVKEDVNSVGEFIRLYLTRNQRWGSPKFLAGESYGTTRAAVLSEHLLDQYGIAVNGIVLMSSALSFQAIAPGNGNDLPYALYVPTYTAVAAYHNKLAPEMQKDLEKTLLASQQWAENEYWVALAKGDSLSQEQQEAVAAKLSGFTGLPADLILKSHLRISPSVFQKMLLADQKKLLGRYDGRVTGDTSESMIPYAEYDPSFSGYAGVYSAGINQYVRGVLKFESDLPYEVLNHRVGPWDFGNEGHGFLYVGDNLRDAMQKNPHIKVLFASGRTDLATPYFATDYMIHHLQLPETLRKNIMQNYYMAGHMMYHDPASRVNLHEDVRKLIESASP